MLSQRNDPHLFDLLGAISTEEDAAGKPMLSAVVVQRGGSGPGMGFFNLARRLRHKFPNTDAGRAEFWLAALGRVYDVHGDTQ